MTRTKEQQTTWQELSSSQEQHEVCLQEGLQGRLSSGEEIPQALAHSSSAEIKMIHSRMKNRWKKFRKLTKKNAKRRKTTSAKGAYRKGYKAGLKAARRRRK